MRNIQNNLLNKILVKIPEYRFKISFFIKKKSEVDDTIQEVLHKILSNMNVLENIDNFDNWFIVTAKNIWLNHKKRNKRNIDFDETYVKIKNEELSITDYEYLVEGIQNLPSNQKTLLQMKYFTNHTISEISQLLKIPEGTVKRRLFTAREKLRKGIKMKEKIITAPEIVIKKTPDSSTSFIIRSGYGLCFGSPVFGIGDTEIIESYEYPGRIFSYKTKSTITRKAQVLGKTVWEVRNDYEKRKGELNRFQYYTVNSKELTMAFRIFNFSPEVSVDLDKEELMPPMKRTISVGNFNNEKENEKGINDIVNLKINNKEYANCLRSRFSSIDYHGKCYSEIYYSNDGREILSRDYIGNNWKMGGFVSFEKWSGAPEVEFYGEKYRLWTEFILVDSYKQDFSKKDEE